MKKAKLITCVGIGVLFAFVMKNANAMMIETDQTKYYSESAITPKNNNLGNAQLLGDYCIESQYLTYTWDISKEIKRDELVLSNNERLYKFTGVVGAMVEDLDDGWHAFDAGGSISLESSQTFTNEIT